ncbi:MAG: tRNA uridine-5-carboxymethylaminomethyl(34) synthesis GTPase MnmE [Deltaproteobacteria bacterium]|nr:tRNA uridine-5-carboxymethylaminomethyl(34) synthesis GTPase MnmE [Deltaproteobacteria bacterium]
MDSDTIAAVATPYGRGGIGILRMSGNAALDIAKTLFHPPSGKSTGPYESHRFYYGRIRDPESGRILDEVMMVYMQGPRSYTREDVVEIHTHSGPAVLRAVFELVLARGARPAEPGEFTRRAFFNGRIDLSQAEAVMEIVSAESRASLEIAAAQIQGGLRKRIETCRAVLLDLLAEITAAIDFPEDTKALIDPEKGVERMHQHIISPLESLLIQYEQGRFFREGIRVVVAGLPNVGKSSLMNCLLDRERAIVTPHPGTTRDFLEEPLDLFGVHATIVDTAGLQETRDPVERIGIQRTREKIEEADLLLFMVDAACPETLQRERMPVFEKPTLLVINKMDRVDPEWRPEIPEAWKRVPVASISALHRWGIDSLKKKMVQQVLGDAAFRLEDPLVPNLRQKEALGRALESARAASESFSLGRSPELVCMDVNDAMDALNEILGETLRPDVLDAVFSRFCIGK